MSEMSEMEAIHDLQERTIENMRLSLVSYDRMLKAEVRYRTATRKFFGRTARRGWSVACLVSLALVSQAVYQAAFSWVVGPALTSAAFSASVYLLVRRELREEERRDREYEEKNREREIDMTEHVSEAPAPSSGPS